MSEFQSRRRLRHVEVSIGTATSTSSTIRADDVAAGCLYVDGVTASAVLTVHASRNGENWLPASGPDGTPSTLNVPATGGAVSLPAVVAGAAYLRLVTDADLGTAATASVTLKS